jgi:endoglucanase
MTNEIKQSNARASGRIRSVSNTPRFLLTCLALGLSLSACVTASNGGGGTGDSAIKTVQLGKQKVGTPAPAVAGENVPAIKVDTVGFPADWPKVVIFNVDPTGAYLADATGKKLRDIDTSGAKAHGLDAASQDQVWQVDIGELAAGEYQLVVGDAKSDVFKVGGSVYERALIAAQKHFYFQRTRIALEAPYATWEGDNYLRETASHAHKDVGWDLEEHPKKKTRWKVEGGWHDAGNFDMYIPSTGPTAQALLMAYEWNPELFADKELNIPESGNGVPDILDETRWGLIWILSIQEEGGAFRHREAVMKWSPEGPADKDTTERWIAGPSSSATAKAVAVLARASRVYRKYDEKFADRCANAAKRGWAWLLEHPEHLRVDGKGAPQPLWDDEPEFTDVGARFVAAAEMWSVFRDKKALELARGYFDTEEAKVEGVMKGAWANVSRWAMAILATDSKVPDDIKKMATERITAAADKMLEQVESGDGYRCASTLTDYYWAHNSNLMEKAHVLAVAARLNPEQPKYLQAARDQWHWILGRNPNGYSMVTRVGKGPDRIYHMEWGKVERPPPGYLIGGPNASNMGFLAPGAPAKALLWDNPEPLGRSGLPPHAMWHWEQSDLWDGGFVKEGEWTEGWWAVTEPDIYYNANLVLVAATLL